MYEILSCIWTVDVDQIGQLCAEVSKMQLRSIKPSNELYGVRSQPKHAGIPQISPTEGPVMKNSDRWIKRALLLTPPKGLH